MEDYFNEDDLINDYIAGAEEEEPPYDEYAYDEPDEPPTAAAAAGGTSNDAGGAGGGNDDEDDEDAAEKNLAVPPLISTSPRAKSGVVAAPSRREASASTSDDPYGFERYAGLSSWRAVRSAAMRDAEAERGGATTMEAAGWKKKEEEEGRSNGGKGGDEDFSSDSDSDDLDKVRKRGRGINDANNAGGVFGGGSYGASNMGGEAQLVRFRERDETIVLGRSWGSGGGSDVRCVYANKSMPTLGEDSMPVTLKDGTRMFVKRGGVHGSSEGPTSGQESEKEKGEDCLLGLPMTELVRRADILQRRAIRRKLERRERYGKSAYGEDDGGDASKDAAAEDVRPEEQDSKNNPSSDADMGDVQPEQPSASNQTTPNDEPEETEISEKEIRLRQLRRKRHHKAMQLQQRLWVDKHAPSSISHLLSDERTNREVLRALRAWDPYVFRRDAPARPLPAYPSKYGNGQDGKDGPQGKGAGKWKKKGGEGEKEGDGAGGGERAREDVRPDEASRAILLSGPPGVGKSTLAHIVCKHAGYLPIEVNASDERTAGALTERVMRAMESSTLDFGNGDGGKNDERKKGRRGGRPNCIILDEVDGADAKQSVAALVDIIRADVPPPGAAKGKKGKGTAAYLRRPIILICNHKYAPALRPILPYARQFDVRPPNPERLAGRLRAVLASERMSVVAGGMLLHRLVGATGGDVRSCLYALQFASARAREVAAKKRREREAGTAPSKGGKDGAAAAMVDISSTLMAALGDGGNGMKDMQSDVSSTVATVFRKAKARGDQNKRRKTSSSGKSAASSPGGVDLVLRAVDRFGDNSKTLDCLFMNVHRVSYVDPTLDRASSALEWLSGADTYRSHKTGASSNDGAEHRAMQKFYMPSAAAAVHLLCRVETRPDLTFSTRPLADLRYGNEANVSLVHRFVEGLAPRARRGAAGGGTDSVVSDVIPYGLWLLSAGEGRRSLSRPASSVDVMTEEEREAFGARVATLRALGLTYVRDNAAGGVDRDGGARDDVVRLEPEIDRLVRFEDSGNGDDGADGGGVCRREVPSQLRELLAHGAAVAAMREREGDARAARREADAAAAATGERKTPKAKVVAPKTAEKPAAAPAAKTPLTKAASGSNSSAAKNFLGFRAAKAKQARAGRRAAQVGLTMADRSAGGTKKVKLTNTGSGEEMSRAVRFKYQKGFTQAVRAPCRLEDLL